MSKENWKIITESGEVQSVPQKSPASYFLAEDVPPLEVSEPAMALEYGLIKPIINFLGYSQQDVAEALEVDPSTLSRWKKENKTIGMLRSKAMHDIDHIIAKGVRLFGSEESFQEWLNASNYALGDKRPVDLLKNPYSQSQVDEALEAMSWGNVI